MCPGVGESTRREEAPTENQPNIQITNDNQRNGSLRQVCRLVSSTASSLSVTVVTVDRYQFDSEFDELIDSSLPVLEVSEMSLAQSIQVGRSLLLLKTKYCLVIDSFHFAIESCAFVIQTYY